MQLEISVVCAPGGRERNEDAYGFWTGSGCCLAVVSDGAGGHAAGDVASRLAVRVVLQSLQEAASCSAGALDAALHAAHRALLAQQAARDELATMRATATVLAIDTAHDTAVWAHVGDTRLYCLRAGSIVAQTKDHSVVQQLVDAGYLPPSALRQSLARGKLFAALGHESALPVSVHETSFPLRVGDAFLLCTDGFWEYVDETAMVDTLARSASPAAWLDAMVADVVRCGGREQDNYSALAVLCRAPT
ncbi:MAG: serine/threonine-protein phosphatase [Burkholderiales bacterium]|nr:serine/threonine-protein phosphatase [Burkholderiales bacterium]